MTRLIPTHCRIASYMEIGTPLISDALREVYIGSVLNSLRSLLMNKRTRSMNASQGASSFAAGVLIGLSIVAPVFAASDAVTDNWSLLLLIGSVVLLLAGLALKAISVSRARKLPPGNVPDMRRDRLARAEVDHALTMGAVPERRFH